MILKKTKMVFITVGALSIVLALVCYGVFTTSGSRFVANQIISEYVDHKGLAYQGLEGNLGSGMTFYDLDIKDIKNLPDGTTLKIQKIFFNLSSVSLNGVDVEIENLRLKLPDSDPIVISGTFKNGELDINIFSKGFTVNEVLSYLPDLKLLVPIKGDVSDIDLFVTGNYLEPIVKGGFIIEEFIYKGFLLTEAPLTIDLQLKDVKGDVKLHGNVYLEKGELQTKRTLIKLDKGNLNFFGAWNQPRINLKGKSRVEKTTIHISLQGTIEQPELNLTSEPPYPRQKLMVMLATGKSWQSVEDSVDNGFDSAALTKDFIDYFFFAGKSNSFGKKFGISDFSVTFNQNQKGISAKKQLSEKLEVGYGIEQLQVNGQEKNISKKIEGEYKVSDKVSVGLEREVQNKQSDELLDEPVKENNDKVLLKYKKSF